MAKDHDIPIEYLRECFNENFDTGILTWKERPLEHFYNEHSYYAWLTRWSNKQAGTKDTKGGIQIKVRYHSTLYLVFAHRIIWALKTGSWPKFYIDHVNGIRSDNRFENLRECTLAENAQNQKLFSNNTSGYRSVSWSNTKKKWKINTQIRGLHRLTFDDPAEASKVYLDARAKVYRFQPVPRDK
jgi:hypothetical protein